MGLAFFGRKEGPGLLCPLDEFTARGVEARTALFGSRGAPTGSRSALGVLFLYIDHKFIGARGSFVTISRKGDVFLAHCCHGWHARQTPSTLA